MAHFAEIDATNTVLRVVVVSNADTADGDGAEVESIGQQFCSELFGGTWIRTSYNNNMRARYASVGGTYDSDVDEFIPPSPYPSWSWDGNGWLPPTPYPDDGSDYRWDEDTTSWVEVV